MHSLTRGNKNEAEQRFYVGCGCVCCVVNYFFMDGEKRMNGKEALIALANGEEVLYINTFYKDKDIELWGDAKECTVSQFLDGEWEFRLKPKTININRIEVPAPFEPKDGDEYWYLTDAFTGGYEKYTHNKTVPIEIGAWRTEEEIKQVVSALRSIFKKGL